jgi:hypothetical protein
MAPFKGRTAALLKEVISQNGGGGNIISNSFIGSFLLDKFPLVLALLPDEFDTIHSFFK